MDDPVEAPKVPLSPAEQADRTHRSSDVDAEIARTERRALGWAAAAAVGAVVWLVMPVGVGILLGTLMAFMLQPLFERMKPRLGARGAALVLVIGSTLTLAGVLGGLASLFVSRGTVITRAMIGALGPDAKGGGVIHTVGRWTTRIGISPEELSNRIRALAESVADRAGEIAQELVATTASALLALFFAMLSMHFILCKWQSVALRAQETLPLRPDYTAKLFAEFRRIGRTTLFGTIVTGLAQGALAAIGYWMTGVEEPVFFGAATALASLIPAVGTLLVWVPAGLVLISRGHAASGVVELVWGTLMVVGLSDYVIRPRMVGGAGEEPSLVTFAALFGGVEVFGLKGLVVGPVMMGVAMSILRLYAHEARTRRAALKSKS